MKPRRRDYVYGVIVIALCLVGLRPPGADAGRAPRDCRRLIPVVVAGERTTMGRAVAIVAKGVRDPKIRPVDATPSQVHRMIDCLAPRWGVSAAEMHSVADCESGANPRAYNPAGPYYSVFQYLEETWIASAGSYGHAGASIYDAYAQVDVTARKLRAEGWGAWGKCI